MEEPLNGLGAMALAELDVIRMTPALLELRRTVQAGITAYVTSVAELPTAWVGLVMTLGHEAGSVVAELQPTRDADYVFQRALSNARATPRGTATPDLLPDLLDRPATASPPGLPPVDDMATVLLSDALLQIVGRHIRRSTSREAHVFEALRALADTTAVVLRAAEGDPAARQFFGAALADSMASVQTVPQSAASGA